MKKVLIHSPNSTDACAYYRGHAAFAPLADRNFDICLAPEKTQWSTILGASAYYMQRPYHDKHIKIAEIVKRQMPLWIDFDDALFDLPRENPAYERFASTKIQGNVSTLCEMADVISFATDTLRASFIRRVDSIQKSKTFVIPNAHNDRLLSNDPPTKTTWNTDLRKGNSKRVLWRGGDSHQGDLLRFAEPLAQVIGENPSWDFIFMGFLPWMLPDGTRYQFTSGRDIMDYFPAIREEIKASIHIVPLADNIFNRSKSNIAWLEGSYAGSVVVGPDWPEWQHPGINLYHDQDSFYSLLTTLLAEDLERLSPFAANSWRTIQNTRTLSIVNRTRLNILESLIQ